MIRGAACTHPRAFVSGGTDLYQVIGPGKRDMTILEDAKTGNWSEVNTRRLEAEPWFLVREAGEEAWIEEFAS